MTPRSLLEYASVRLFIDRAVAVKADFALASENAAALASICHRLDGIPLAVELAAARVRAMPLDQIEARLDHRFRLLTGGSRTALPRQQTLRALIDWSYDLLNEPEKALLGRLSVFAGGWTLEAAEPVCSGEGIEDWEVLDLLTSLVDKSLVVYQEREGRARYRLLETVRQYARDRLVEAGESEVIRSRHRGYFLALTLDAEPKLKGADQAEWLQRLEEDYENLRAALGWCLFEEDGSGEGLRFCGALSRFWWLRGHLSEGREWCELALGKAEGQARTLERAKVLYGAGALLYFQGDYTAANSSFEESLAIRREIGDQRDIADSLNSLGAAAQGRGDYASACLYFEESLTLRRTMGDRHGIAISLNNLGLVVRYQGDYASAVAYFEESLAIYRVVGDQQGIASSLTNLGAVASTRGDYASAVAYFEESLVIYRAIGDRRGFSLSLSNLGIVANHQGDYASAQTYVEESLGIQREIGDQKGIADSLNNLGIVANHQGDYASSHAYHEESLTIRTEIGDRRGIAESLTNLGGIAFDQGDYAASETCYEESLAIQREIGERKGIAALGINLGLLATARGDDVSARAYCEEGLILYHEMGDRSGIACALEAFAGLAVKESSRAATVLWGAAEALREAIGSPLPPNERESHDRTMTEARQALGEEVFSAAWSEGRAMTLDQATAFALRKPV